MLELLVRLIIILVILLIFYIRCKVAFWIMIAAYVLIIGLVIYDKRHPSESSSAKTENADNIPTDNDFKQSLGNGDIETYDDIVYRNGEYYENENSEEWQDFEYQYEEDHRK